MLFFFRMSRSQRSSTLQRSTAHILIRNEYFQNTKSKQNLHDDNTKGRIWERLGDVRAGAVHWPVKFFSKRINMLEHGCISCTTVLLLIMSLRFVWQPYAVQSYNVRGLDTHITHTQTNPNSDDKERAESDDNQKAALNDSHALTRAHSEAALYARTRNREHLRGEEHVNDFTFSM